MERKTMRPDGEKDDAGCSTVKEPRHCSVLWTRIRRDIVREEERGCERKQHQKGKKNKY